MALAVCRNHESFQYKFTGEPSLKSQCILMDEMSDAGWTLDILTPFSQSEI